MSTLATKTVSAIVCVDHPIFRDGIAHALTAGGFIDVIAEFDHGRAALKRIRELRPEVVVIDYRMPSFDGLQLVREIVREDLPTRSLVVSACDDSATIYEALYSGAAGFLSKQTPGHEIAEAVLSIALGENIVPPQLSRGLPNEIRRRGMLAMTALTQRERDVITRMAQGYTVAEIARQLCISPNTVRTHVQKLYDKLGVSDRGAAVAEAMRRGLVE